MTDLSQPQLRLLALYEFRRGSSATTATTNITSAFGKDVVAKRTVQNWFVRFKRGDTELEDKSRVGRPPALDDDVLLDAIKEDPGVSVRELETRLGHGHSTIDRRLESLGYRKVLTRWVPHAMTDGLKMTRLTICQSLLLRSHRKEFLEDIVTGDESWVLYESNTRRAVWIPRGEEPPTQPKPNLHPQKILLCCFWDSRGMLYYELLGRGKTVTASVYATQLQKLATAIGEKRPRRTTVHLLHDNARPHVSKVTQAKLEELGWDTVPHPPYSPDLAPSDYHLFRPLKAFLARKSFVDFDDIVRAVADFFDSQSPAFWEKGVSELPVRWTTVLANDGDYIID